MASTFGINRGKLKLKGENKASKILGKRTKDSMQLISDDSTNEVKTELNPEDFLTEAQKRHQRKKLEHEKREVKAVSETSFRERIERFNNKLSSMTEHNDIPRVSAAGNG